MYVSVEISTYNRKEILKSTLEKLSNQTHPFDQFEVVVSDDGSSDNTFEMIMSIESSLPYKLKFLQNKHLGVGENHNQGIKECKGEIVIMLADDIFAEPQLIEEHVKSHKEHPKPEAFVVGRLRQSPELHQTAFQRCWDSVLDSIFSDKLDFMDGYIDFKVSNMSFKREFMINNGMFRGWPSASHEDFELRYRLKQKGMKIFTNPKAFGYHHHAETVDNVSRRIFVQGFNWHYFEDNVPDLWIRIKSGHINIADGKALYIKTVIKRCIREILISHLTINLVVLPMVRNADRLKIPGFIMYFFAGKIASYNFYKGLKEYKKKQIETENREH